MNTMLKLALSVVLGSVGLGVDAGTSAAETSKAPSAMPLPEQRPVDGADDDLAATDTPTLCVRAHVQNIGWQGWSCAEAGQVITVGTTGQSLRLEALEFYTIGMGGGCAQAHVQNIGWQGWTCWSDGQVAGVGTTGRSLRMEALRIGFFDYTTDAQAHVQNIGWQGWRSASPGYALEVGTTGQSLRMEALAIAFQ